jgi:hypothetical protein
VNTTQNFDTLNIRLPIAIINSINEERFKYHETPNGIQVKQLGTRELRNIHGLNLIRINEVAGEIILGLSAKILGRSYPDMLNSQTIPIALERVQATGLLSFDTAAAMAAAEALLLVPAKDISLLHTVPRYTHCWHLLHVNTKYLVNDFRNASSLTFAKQVRTAKAKEYAKLYDKAHELEMDKNKAFRESLTIADLSAIRTQFRNKARFECELKTITKIRQYYGLTAKQPVKLSTVLASDRNPLSTMFERITADMAAHPEASEIRLFMEGLTENETEVFGFCNAYGFDLEKIEAKYKSLYKRKDTARRKVRAAKELVSRLRAQQNNLQMTDFQLINELRQQIIR